MLKMIKRLLKVAEDYRGRIRAAFVFSFLKAMLMKAPVMIGFVILTNFIDGNMTGNKCLSAGIALIICLAFECIFQHIADRLQSVAGFMVFADLRMKLGEHLRHLPMGYFTEGNVGKISSVLSTDMVFIEENCMMVIADMMTYLFSQMIMVIFMFFFDIRLGLAALFFCLMMLITGQGMTRDALKHSTVRQEQSEKLTDAVLDFAEGMGIIKTYNLLGEKSKELTGNFDRSCKKSIEFEETQAKWSRRIFLCYAIGTAGILGLSYLLFSNERIEMSYFIGMMLFVFELFVPLRIFYSQLARLTVMDSCLDRIEEVFHESEMADNGTERFDDVNNSISNIGKMSDDIDEISEIEYRNVSFSYGEKEVLHGISFEVKRNEMLALVGPSGGGKSTIASLLARLWDISDGEILIRRKDIKKVPLCELMEQISIVFQRVYLFKDTIYNNIVMGRPSASKEEVIEAAKKARCYDFIMALPEGFDTVVGEGGASLSGGEMQRISIARCILKNTPIIILDEATASVDVDNESYIQKAITELVRGKTLIVIAHRLYTIQGADKIIVVSDGNIAEQGNHEELMKMNGMYQKMVEKQQRKFTIKLS